jgi:hypothetical protein
MDGLPLVHPQILRENHIQPAEPSELGPMLQCGEDSSAVPSYSRNKDRPNKDARAAILSASCGLWNSENRHLQLDENRRHNPNVFGDDGL